MIKKLIAACIFLFWNVPSFAQSTADSSIGNNAFVSWAHKHAYPLQASDKATDDKDLYPIKQMIGDARVVALGEPAHGFHEPLAFRNRLFKFLVQHCGFTTIAIEGDLAQSRLAADYIAGGRGTAKDAAAALSIGEPAAENIELLNWMRQYNADSAHTIKLRFYGMDIQMIGFPGGTTPNHAALDHVLTYLQNVDEGAARRANVELAFYLTQMSVAKYPALSLKDQNVLTIILENILALLERQRMVFINRSSKDAYQWAHRNAIAALQRDRMMRVIPPDQPGKIPPNAWKAMNARDAAMADNINWILHNGANGGKVLVFAHNAHVKNAPTTGGVWDAFAQPPNSAGEYLRSILGNNFFIIGSSIAPETTTLQANSLDKALLQVNRPRYILDLRAAAPSPEVAHWLSLNRPMQANKVSFFMLPVSTAFDALLFLDKDDGK
ncbi:erythromycin esterase family protein [Niabella yanshanensis]|uniref:Erythromycin esterase family protein n=1 Tax=Niabella yanshanensis TaxID=577386 RepID=A0ABZ0WBA1_9BACT|nr:erythromycin esterase family protein [Niabella yanshanensis]WQD39747.1 erythromycin esterase family protein [Niabella yanshanensis]